MTDSIISIGLVDDDRGMLLSLERLLKVHGYTVYTFSSAESFLADYKNLQLHCAILDLSLPGMSGLEMQQQITRSGSSLPILFLSGQGDIPASVRAIKAGAVNFLTKPLEESELLNAVRLALIEGSKARAERRIIDDLKKRFDLLSQRETEVLRHVITGDLNKQIAGNLGVSEQTIKIHRMRLTEKTGIHSVAELVRAAELLCIPPAH